MKQIKFFYLFIFFIVLGLRCGLWAFSSFGKQALESLGSVAEAHGLSCPGACGILVPRPGIIPISLALEGRFLTTGHQGNPSPPI